MSFALFSSMYRYLIFIYLIFISLHVQGVEVKDLYLAKVPVDNQSLKARNQAIKHAFEIVLVKIGGRSEILDEPLIKSTLVRYQQFVSAYRYERQDQQLNIVASFDEKKVNDLFAESELPIWGSLRPQVVMWILLEEKLKRRVLSDVEFHSIIQTVKEFSADRGLPIVIPLMDLSDSQNITMPDLWGRFYAPINRASARYQAEATVVMRVSDVVRGPTADEEIDCSPICKKTYQLDWQFIEEEGAAVVGSEYIGNELQLMVQQALVDLTDVVYQDYAINVNAEQTLLVNVADADSLADTMRVSEYLNNLSVVQSVTLVKVNESVRQFKLELLGTKAAFIASLSLDNALQQRLDPLAPVDPDAIPVLYWSQP